MPTYYYQPVPPLKGLASEQPVVGASIFTTVHFCCSETPLTWGNTPDLYEKTTDLSDAIKTSNAGGIFAPSSRTVRGDSGPQRISRHVKRWPNGNRR